MDTSGSNGYIGIYSLVDDAADGLLVLTLLRLQGVRDGLVDDCRVSALLHIGAKKGSRGC